jgi:hypothetical protein
MKRYWKIISLCIVVIMVVGIFYIQVALASNEGAKIEIEKVSGKEDEMKDLILYGAYVDDKINSYLNQSLKITTKETINLGNQSLLQEIANNNTVPVLKKLIEQYRNFMRSKELMPNNFYEDKNLLAYASIKEKNLYGSTKNITFDIDVLDKKLEKTTAFQLEIPIKQNYGYMDTVDVQAVDGKLKVISQGFRSDGGHDLKVYLIDIKEQKLGNEEVIYSDPTVKNVRSDISVLNDYNSIQPQNYLLYKIVNYENKKVQGEGEMDGVPNILANEVMVYDLEKNQFKKIDLPEEILGADGEFLTIYNSSLFILTQSESVLEVNQYDIEKDKWGKKLTFDLQRNPVDEGFPYVKVLNGKIVTIHATNNGHAIFIRDLKTGESLYEGKLKVKNTKDGQKDYRFYVHEVESVQ